MFSVAVHAGAGFHSKPNERSYKELCTAACYAAADILRCPATETSAIDAATAAVRVLEDHILTNAGFGSCLSIDGTVECDAGVMCGKTLKFCSVGSVRCIKNPIDVARAMLIDHLGSTASETGRIKPLTLCGEGAANWARDFAGIPLVPADSLISKPAHEKWRKYRKLVNQFEGRPCPTEVQLDPQRPLRKRPRFIDRLDTVGAVCIDSSGNVCAALSSGGIPLKMPRKEISTAESVNAGSDDTQSSPERFRKRRRFCSNIQSICHHVYDRLKVIKKEDGTLLVDALRLPNKRTNPAYYESINSPMDPARICGKIKSEDYQSIGEMADDIKLMVSNARSFFGVSSQEATDATEFEAAFDQESKQVLQLQSFTSAASTSSASSTVTDHSRRRTSLAKEKRDDEETDGDAVSVAASEDSHQAPSEASTTATGASHRSANSEQVQEAFFAAVVNYKTDDGRQIAPTFATLPSKQVYPQYYEVITEPIDLRMIAQRVLSGAYQTLGEMEREFLQMARNARHFNEPKSRIYQDAQILTRIVKIKKAEARKRFSRPATEEKDEATAHEIIEDYAALPDVLGLSSPPGGEPTKTEPADTSLSAPPSEVSDKEASALLSSSPAVMPVKRGRGRPRKRPLETSYSSPESSRQSTPSRQTPLGGGGGRVSSFSREASLLGGESGTEFGTADDTQTTTAGYSLPSASPATVALSTSFGSSDGNTSGLGMGFMDEVIPSMLSTAAVGSLRWWGEHVLEAICTATNSTGRLLAMPFMRLPSKKLYPDYYRKIAHPICLAKIRRRIKRNEYDGLADVRHDLDLAFNNAQLYNMEGSAVYNDAVFLQQLTKNKFVELSQIAAKTENAVRAVRVSAPRRRLGVPMSGSTSASPSMDASGSDTRRPIGRHPMTAEEAKTKRLSNLFHAVYNYVDEHGHYPRDTFMVLPSKEEYPDYYTVITEPIDLTMIKERMDNNLYSTHQAMVADLRLMFNNAKHYNEENSQVYRDAVSLDRVVKKKLKSLGPYSSLGSLSPAGSALKVRKMSPLEKQQEFVNYGTTYGVTLGPSLTPGSPGGLQSGQTGQSNVPPLQRLMMEVFQAVREYREPGPNGRQLSVPFMRLPSQSELPSYYEFIKKPIEMQEIAKNLLQGVYQSFDEFMADLFLMFDNACSFNEPDSQIYQDTLILHRVALAKRNMVLSAAFSSGTPIPGLAPSVAPDIMPGIRRLLTSLHNSMLTACDSEGRGLVDSLIAGDGTETSLTSATAARLAALHRSVAAGAYRRLDRLQADWLEVLRRARVGEESTAGLSEEEARSNRPTPQQRQDAAELTRRWVRLRDSLCRRQSAQPLDTIDGCVSLPSNVHIVSSATSYTEVALERDLKDEVLQREPIVFGDDDGEEDLPPLGENEVEHSTVEVRGQIYRPGDYVYIDPLRPSVGQYHIGRITRISGPSAQTTPTESTTANSEGKDNCSAADGGPSGSEDGVTSTAKTVTPTSGMSVRVALYFRPTEAKPSRRRRLLAAEVFRTALGETVPPGKLMGHCLVLPITQFIRCRPKNVDERDVFVCESQFSLSGQIFVKIRRWGAPTPYGVELEDRPVPFVPTRLPPSEPLESALEQVNTNAFTCMTFPLPRPVQSVVDDMSKADEVISYEQYAHENGFIIKQGDCLFVAPPSGSGEKQIVRIDKITKNTSDDTVYFTGVVMVSPAEVDHLPTRLFYPREVFMTNNEKATFPLSAALGKCFVMRPADFCIARPTGYRESEVYICESRYHEDEKQLRKLKKPFKKYNFTPETLEDEFFFFPQPIVPLKEASPMLGKVSPTPLSMEQLDRPASSALASVVASANLPSSGVPATIPTSFESSIQAKPDPTTPNVVAQRPAPQQQVLDLGQLAFMEAGLDRSGKKRKLRKPPSGYVIYAGEVRKKLLHERPDAPFGEISREVGLLWRQMPANERDVYERKAQLIKRRMEEEEIFGGPGLHAGNLHHESLTRGVSGSVENNLITMVPAGPVAAAQGVSLHPGPTAASQQHQPSAMHFYQTPTGQVIQLMHTTAGAGVAATGVITTAGGGSATTLRAPPQPVTSLGGPVAVQSNMDHGTPLMAGATTVIANPVPQVVGNVGSGHAPLIAASASQQVVYQFTGQQATPCGSGLPPPNVNIGGPVSGHQVILTHPMNQQGPPIGGNVLATQPQSFATAPGHLMHATRQAVPMPLPQHQANSQQPCVQVLQQINPGPDNHAMSATQSTTGSPAMTSLPSAVGLQPCTVTPGTTASTAAGVSTFVNQPQAPPRPPSPLFVSLPPRTSRVLHSEIYQRYIDRLRRNAPGLSDWRKQLAATVDSVPPLTPQQQQQMANNFLDTPHIHAHQGSIVEALWSLRDNLLKDSLNIRVRCLGVEEL
ncbi:hypothetical protein AAHC03_0883 [Spirometra sp. Aus1]